MPFGFQLLTNTPHILPGIRELFTYLGQEIRTHRNGKRDIKPGHAMVLTITPLANLLIDPPAIITPDLFYEIIELDELLGIEIGHSKP